MLDQSTLNQAHQTEFLCQVKIFSRFIELLNFILLFFVKNLGLLSILRFTSTACSGENGDSGTCLTERDCASKGGKIIFASILLDFR